MNPRLRKILTFLKVPTIVWGVLVFIVLLISLPEWNIDTLDYIAALIIALSIYIGSRQWTPAFIVGSSFWFDFLILLILIMVLYTNVYFSNRKKLIIAVNVALFVLINALALKAW
jgi:hypothetical protein